MNGRIVMRQCGRGHEFVAMLDPEREHRKTERSMQRKQFDDRRWAVAITHPMTPIDHVNRMRVRVTRRAAVLYARIERAFRSVR